MTDLSRLGRNNALVAYYTEIFFVEKQIRFICINDGIDTAFGDNDIMPFKSIINEFYAKDISKKIRSVKAIQQQQGKRLGGAAPYGYLVDPNDKHHLIVDHETAPIIKRIFEMSAEGKGTHTIAKTLTLDGVWTPRDYTNGSYTGMEWRHEYIYTVLRNMVYLGHMVANRQPKPSFKSNKRIRTDESEWTVVRGTHEAIISEKLFDMVKRRIGVKKRRNSSGLENVFVGLAKCVDCNSNLGISQNKDKGIVYLCCHKFRKFSKNKCTPHYIQYGNLYNLVLEEIRENAAIVKANESHMEEFIREELKGYKKRNAKCDEAILAKLTRRKDEIDKIIRQLYEDKVLGNITSERFYEMSSVYDKEQAEVLNRIDKLKAELSVETDHEGNYQQFFEVMKEYVDVEALNATMLYKIIERIDVHAPEGRHPNRSQQVDIHYRFIKEGLNRPEN